MARSKAKQIAMSLVVVIAVMACLIGLLEALLPEGIGWRTFGVGLVAVGLLALRIDQASRHHDALIVVLTEAKRPMSGPRAARTAQPADPRPKRIDELLERADNA